MNLNQDIVAQILLRLPAKSLLRFRSVCKSWYALIKSSRFIDKHYALQRAIGNDRIIVNYFKNSENKHVVSYYNDYESLSFFVSPPEFEIPGYPKVDPGGWSPMFVGEVNGIICLTDTYTISLMNPALREFRMLPAFSYRAIGIGFGFDVSTNVYKVLIIDYFYDHGPTDNQCGAVYNLSSNSWRDLGRIPLLDSYYLHIAIPYLFFKGSVHWYVQGQRGMIITFNMTTESFKEMQTPQDLPEDFSHYSLLFVVDKSFMALVSITEPEPGSSSRFLNKWVMKEYGVEDSWTKKYCIEVIPSIGRPLSFWKKDKLLFNTSNEIELVSYDLPTGELNHIRQFDISGLFVFNESLVSINSI